MSNTSSPEPSPSSVPGLESDASTVSSTVDHVVINSRHNAFAAERERDELRAGGSQSNTTPGAVFPHISTQGYLPSSPTLHARSGDISRASFDTLSTTPHADVHTTATPTSAPTLLAVQGDNEENRLPRRPEPPARTTFDRVNRGLRHVFRQGNPIHDEGTEMTTLRRASVSNPRLFRDGLAKEVRDREREQQRADDGVQAQTQAEQHVHNQWWKELGLYVGGVVVLVAIYGAVTKFKKPE